MTSRDFAYWLQGFFEIHRAQAAGSDASGAPSLTSSQVACIEKHLALVFVHEIDPSMGPAEHQAKLDKIHNPDKPESPRSSGGGHGPYGPRFNC